LGWLEYVFYEVQRFRDFQDFLLELIQVTLVFSANRHTRDIPTELLWIYPQVVQVYHDLLRIGTLPIDLVQSDDERDLILFGDLKDFKCLRLDTFDG
jgi:hypothetical protein